MRIGFACAEFNGGITDRLLTGALDALEESGADLDDAVVAWVPGAFELPVVAQRLAESTRGRRRGVPGGGDPGRYRPLRIRGRRVCLGAAAGPARHRKAGRVRGADHRDGRPGTGALRADDDTNKGREAASTALRTAAVLSAVSATLAGSPGSGSRSGALMLRVVLPKGSLEQATLDLFAAADLTVMRSSDVDYRAVHRGSPGRRGAGSCGPRRSPSTWPTASSTWASPAATGSRSGGARSPRLGVLNYSKATSNPIRVVLAVPTDSPVASVADLAAHGQRCGRGPPGVHRVPRAHPALSRAATASRPRSACPTAPPRPRSPTSPTAWWRSPRRAGRSGPPG